MTNNSDKIRSLILAALMVFSVFAGTVALTGSAAAANDVSFTGLTADDTSTFVNGQEGVVEGDQTQPHTLTFEVDGLDTNGQDRVNVTLPAGTYEDVEGVTVTDGSFVGGSASVSDDGQTASFNITNTGASTATIAVEFIANWPSVDEKASGPVSVTVGETGNDNLESTDITTLTIVENGLDAGTFYNGQSVSLATGDSNTDYEVSQVNDNGADPDSVGQLERIVTTDENGVATFDLDGDLSEGDFVVTEESSGDVVEISGGGDTDVDSDQFSVVAQDLTAEFDESSVGNEGGNTVVEYEIASDVRNNYDVNISAQGDLDTEDLSSIFGGDNVTTNYTDEDTVTVDGDTTYDLDFEDIDADSYTFEANVTDTDSSDSDDIEVTDTGSATANYGSNIFTQQRGDIANITVEMENTDTATIQLGDIDNGGYAISAEVTDDDEDGVAYVEFNTFTAAGGDASETLTAGDDDTDLSNVATVTDSFTRSDDGDVLDAGDYRLFIIADEKDSGDGPADPIDTDAYDFNRGTLDLTEPSVDNLQVWTAPADSLSDLEDADAEDIPAFAQAGNLTQTDTIADEDTVVVQIEASGLEGAATTEGYAADQFTSVADDQQVFDLNFEGEGALNQGDESGVDLSTFDTGDYSVLYDGANDAHYVVMDSVTLTDELSDYENGDDITANFTAYDADSDLFEDDTSVTQDFSIEDREAELDTNADDEIVLSAAPGQEVTGDTNLAPGTEIEVSLDSDTSGDPFVKRPEATVQQDGTFTAVADFSENSPDSTFTASITDPSNFNDEYDGRLVEGDAPVVTPTPDEPTDDGTAEPTDTETAEPTDTETSEPMDPTETETATATDGNATETGTTGGSGPGFTAALALIALVAAALLAVRRNN